MLPDWTSIRLALKSTALLLDSALVASFILSLALSPGLPQVIVRAWFAVEFAMRIVWRHVSTLLPSNWHMQELKRINSDQRMHPINRYERRVLFSKILPDMSREFLMGWFIDTSCAGAQLTDFSKIYRENLAEWLSWAFFASGTPTKGKEMSVMINRIESKLGIKLPYGYNEGMYAYWHSFIDQF